MATEQAKKAAKHIIEDRWQKNVNANILTEAIEKKERKIDNYIRNTNLPQWCLLS